MFCTIITRMYISRHDIVIMMQVIIHHFHHYNRARQDWLCCHVTNSCYFFCFSFFIRMSGPQMGVFFGMECVHPGQNRSVRQKFYNQRNHNRQQNELRHFAQKWLFYVSLTSKEGNIAFLPHPLRAMLCPCSSYL